jgi:hypothetical protein
MSVDALFALELTPHTIRLSFRLHGVWTVLGDASLAAPGVKRHLAELVRLAERLHAGPVVASIILPRTHIRYVVLHWDLAGTPVDHDAVRRRVGDLTACAVDELLFDWAPDGASIRIAIAEAVVVREADVFVRELGVTPSCMTARPLPKEFPRPPLFRLASDLPP